MRSETHARHPYENPIRVARHALGLRLPLRRRRSATRATKFEAKALVSIRRLHDITARGQVVENTFWLTLPNEYKSVAYRSQNPDLASMTDAQLLDHFERFGRTEGRTANRLHDRRSFSRLVPKTANVLEIGPFCAPLLRGPNVSYFDVLTEEQLTARAKLHGLDPTGIPHIDYVSPTGDLGVVDRYFDFAISSHCLEHQPDLIHHLQQVRNILKPDGAYLALIPDKRYCFDHFIPISNLAEILAAHYERRKVHSLRSVLEHRALITHNDASRHWSDDHGRMFDNVIARVEAALQEFRNSNGTYLDVHAWYFTPESACDIISELRSTGIINFNVAKLYSTRLNTLEFWLVLRAVSD